MQHQTSGLQPYTVVFLDEAGRGVSNRAIAATDYWDACTTALDQSEGMDFQVFEPEASNA
jgi:hypothetical protein